MRAFGLHWDGKRRLNGPLCSSLIRASPGCSVGNCTSPEVKTFVSLGNSLQRESSDRLPPRLPGSPAQGPHRLS